MFLSLKGRWNEVLQRCTHTIFSTWEWLAAGWKYFGKGKKLLVLLAKENGRIIGIAPLMYSVETMFGLRRGKIEFMGAPYSDYNNFLLTERSEECIRAFINYLKSLSENWEYADLNDIPQNSQTLFILRKISGNVKPIHKCASILLPKSYDLFLSSLSANLRKDLRWNLRKLQKDGYKVNFANYSNIQLLDEGMRAFFELHQKRWVSKGRSGVYAEEGPRNFALDVAKAFSQKGWLGLYVLKLSDKPVSALFGFKYHSRFCYYLSGFDPSYHRYSVGTLLIGHAIGDCIRQRLSEFDLLRGGEEHKNRWASLLKWNHQAIFTKKGAMSNVQHQLYNVYWHQGQRLKYFLRMKK